MGSRLTKVLVLAGLAIAGIAASGAAASPRRAPLGIVPHTSQSGAVAHALSELGAASSAGFLTFDASYQSLINRYLTDVAAASGSSTNVYSIATQYNDGAGPIQYQSSFAGSYVDPDPLPPSGCADGTDAACLTDFQLQQEIQTVLTREGWHGSTTNMFFFLTPNGVGSCIDGSSTQCTTNVFCAYHNGFTDPSGEPVIYADEPYDATITGCSPGSSPNGGDADATINTISHEHNEAITDPFGDAWYAPGNEENGDLCAWNFGTPLGGTPGTDAYNQVINGDHYWLQQEYSNMGNTCLQDATQEHPPNGSKLAYHGGQVMHTNATYAIYWLPTPGNTAAPVVTGTAAIDQTLTSSAGSWNGAPTGYSYQWQRCSASGTACVNIPGATTQAYMTTSADVGGTLRSTVSAQNTNGASGYVASVLSTAVLPLLPRVTKAPQISGLARIGRRLSGLRGSWSGPPTSYSYEWLRCNPHGRSCRRITRATHATYRLTQLDARHRLRLRVTAVNAAGSRTATTRATARVPAKR